MTAMAVMKASVIRLLLNSTRSLTWMTYSGIARNRMVLNRLRTATPAYPGACFANAFVSGDPAAMCCPGVTPRPVCFRRRSIRMDSPSGSFLSTECKT
jgi:hypothetical protein